MGGGVTLSSRLRSLGERRMFRQRGKRFMVHHELDKRILRGSLVVFDMLNFANAQHTAAVTTRIAGACAVCLQTECCYAVPVSSGTS